MPIRVKYFFKISNAAAPFFLAKKVLSIFVLFFLLKSKKQRTFHALDVMLLVAAADYWKGLGLCAFSFS